MQEDRVLDVKKYEQPYKLYGSIYVQLGQNQIFGVHEKLIRDGEPSSIYTRKPEEDVFTKSELVAPSY